MNLKAHTFANIITVLGAGSLPIAMNLYLLHRGLGAGERVRLGFAIFFAVCGTELLALLLFRPAARWMLISCRRLALPLWIPSLMVVLASCLAVVVAVPMAFTAALALHPTWQSSLGIAAAFAGIAGFLFVVYWLVFVLMDRTYERADV
jgi:hypothetical protein